MMGLTQRVSLVLLTAVILPGCAATVRQIPTEAAVMAPDAWREVQAAPSSIDPDWWRAFGDPLLSELVSRALARNTDVFIATARVEEARLTTRLARAARAPVIDAVLSGGVSRRLSEVSGTANEGTAIQPEILVGWDADIFGRLRSLDRAAHLRYRATAAERDAVALAIAATTAQGYISLVSLDALLTVSRETLASRQEALRIAEDRARVGYSSQLQLRQAQSEYEAVAQSIPNLELAIRRQENALRVLSGDLPGELQRVGLQELVPPTVPGTLPSELFRRRPDLVQAELALVAADASYDARRAELLPTVRLSASVGTLLVNGLGFDPLSVWNVGASALAPIFNADRLKTQADVAAVQRDQLAFNYQRVALRAFSEVENALTGVQRYEQQITHARARRSILQESVELARDRYRAGYASYLEELDAQRNLFDAELDAISIRQRQLNNLVTLYETLGGGWIPPSIP